jgi:hypothetical protein
MAASFNPLLTQCHSRPFVFKSLGVQWSVGP